MLPDIEVLMIGTLFVGKAANRKETCETINKEIGNQFSMITVIR